MNNFIIAKKTLRLLSWIITNFIVVIITVIIVLFLFNVFIIQLPLEYKILTFYIILNSLLWINFIIIPLFCHGYTIGHKICKIQISGNKITFWNLFFLSWHNSLFLLNLNTLIILVNNFNNSWIGFSYIAYFSSVIITTISIISAISFMFNKETTLTINEISAKLIIISVSNTPAPTSFEKPVKLNINEFVSNKNINKEIDKILKEDNNE